MAAKLKTAVVGATGYSGFELTRILLRHPHVDPPVLLSRNRESNGTHNLADLFPAISGNGSYPLKPLSWPALKQQEVELLFLCTPHEASRALVPEFLNLSRQRASHGRAHRAGPCRYQAMGLARPALGRTTPPRSRP